MTLESCLHLLLHGLVPGVVAWGFFRTQWHRAWLIMLATMVVDVDHLLADPVYDPQRCSIGFHPLHRAPAIALYTGMTLLPATRLLGLGLVIHMSLDATDCLIQKR